MVAATMGGGGVSVCLSLQQCVFVYIQCINRDTCTSGMKVHNYKAVGATTAGPAMAVPVLTLQKKIYHRVAWACS